MSNKLSTLEDFMKQYIENKKISNEADSFDTYKYKNGINYNQSYASDMQSLYADYRKNAAGYGRNFTNISNKGLQNSGYFQYVNDKSLLDYAKGISNLQAKRDAEYTKALSGYSNYLKKYSDKQTSLKKNVTSHLIKNNVVNLDDAVAFGLAQGLSEADAIAVGKNAYSVTKQKIFNNILQQSASLGLDKDGAVLLAKKMGVTDSDAEDIGREVEELLKHYKNLSSDYLEYLENRSDKTTNTFD